MKRVKYKTFAPNGKVKKRDFLDNVITGVSSSTNIYPDTDYLAVIGSSNTQERLNETRKRIEQSFGSSWSIIETDGKEGKNRSQQKAFSSVKKSA